MRTASRAGAQIAFGGLLVGDRLFEIVLRHRERLIEFAQARQIAGGQFQHAGGGDQGRFGLQQIGAVDGEQRLALLHVVADLGKQRDDAALIGREHLRRHVLVEIDAADRLLLDREIALFDRLDLDRSKLRIRQIDAVALRRRLVRRLAGLGAGVRGGRVDLGGRSAEQAPSAER